MITQDHENAEPTTLKRVPWDKGKLIGTNPPLRAKHVWSIRTKLQVEGRTRDRLCSIWLSIASFVAVMSSPSKSRISFRVGMQSIGPRSDRKRRGSLSGSS